MSDRADMRTLSKAIADDWQIPADVLTELPEKLREIMQTGSHRDIVAASKVLVSLLRQQTENLKLRNTLARQQQDQPTELTVDERRADLLRRAERLGVTSFGEATE